MNALGMSLRESSPHFGLQALPTALIVFSDDRSNLPMFGSFNRRISSCRHDLEVADLVTLDLHEHIFGLGAGPDHDAGAVNMKPESGHASGKLCAIGSTTSRTPSSSTSQTSAAHLRLYA